MTAGPVDPVGLTCRLARPADQIPLSHFDCPSAHPAVEDYIRGDALDRHLNRRVELDYRLLVWTKNNGDLVAVAAHKRNLDCHRDGIPFPGTEIVVVAIAAAYRDSTYAGRPTIATVVGELLDDIAACDRGDFVAAVVQPGNDDGERLTGRLGLEEVGTRDGDVVYARFGPILT